MLESGSGTKKNKARKGIRKCVKLGVCIPTPKDYEE